MFNKKILICGAALIMLLAGCDNGMSHQIEMKTMNADKAIENYEWFIQQEADIRAKYKQEERAQQDVKAYLEFLPKDIKEWTRQDRDEVQRLKTIASGIGYQVDGMVEDYNAKSSMKHKVLFKNNLPTNIYRTTRNILEFKYGI